ncbi:hypothetical protein KJ603_01005 [Patescibacteria group bacterium]|nr:hypothetical protein [Patescibacteria group bacterium]
MDVLSGEVIAEDKIRNFFDKKYKLINPFEREAIKKVMQDFIDNRYIFVLNDEDEKIAQKIVRFRKEENIIRKTLAVLKENDSWLFAWIGWRDTDFWEDIEEFILSADDKIKEILDLDCSCPLCHLLGKELEKNKRVEVNWDFDNIKSNTGNYFEDK